MHRKNMNEQEKFENLFDKLIAVPHADIKQKLDDEKRAKKRKKSKKSSASGRVTNDRA